MFIRRANQAHLRNKRPNTEVALPSSKSSNLNTHSPKNVPSSPNHTYKENELQGEIDDENAYSDNDLNNQIKSVKKALHQSSKRNKFTTSNDDNNTAKSKLLQAYNGDRTISIATDQRATADFSVDEQLNDHRSILERNEEIGRKILKGELEEGVYRGLGAYKPIINRREGAVAAGKYTGNYGPVRGTSNVRMTMRIDLNPEVCKDYKETGYCGYGDTCKFIHDRSDYKSGWQLEKEWNEQQKQKQSQLQKQMEKNENEEGDLDSDESANDDEFDSDDDDVPFACLMCKKKWAEGMNPVVTCCNHYFCESCAFKHYAKTSKCFICKSQTQGIFNSAEITIEKILKKKNG